MGNSVKVGDSVCFLLFSCDDFQRISLHFAQGGHIHFSERCRWKMLREKFTWWESQRGSADTGTCARIGHSPGDLTIRSGGDARGSAPGSYASFKRLLQAVTVKLRA